MKQFGFMHVLKRYELIIKRYGLGHLENMHVLKRYEIRFRVCCDETIWVYACSEAL